LVLTACATMPTGPSVMVLPAQGKPFDLFQQEDASCRRWAEQQIGMSPQAVVEKNTVTGAAVGTAIGAGLGAAIGSASGHAGTGAAIGGASGLLLGTSAGADSGQVYGHEAQRRYDAAYLQCMYANGNQIPTTSRRTNRSYRPPSSWPPPPPGTYGYPPPDTPPPPPRRIRPGVPPDYDED
jgi:hypothetical protein